MTATFFGDTWKTIGDELISSMDRFATQVCGYGTVKLDAKGFVLTGGPDGFQSTLYATSAPGMYAVGDVRANSVKRVASAVGEGSVVISDVHRYLAGHRDNLGAQPDSTLAGVVKTIVMKGT